MSLKVKYNLNQRLADVYLEIIFTKGSSCSGCSSIIVFGMILLSSPFRAFILSARSASSTLDLISVVSSVLTDCCLSLDLGGDGDLFELGDLLFETRLLGERDVFLLAFPFTLEADLS
jgi:hypothetical protein